MDVKRFLAKRERKVVVWGGCISIGHGLRAMSAVCGHPYPPSAAGTNNAHAPSAPEPRTDHRKMEKVA
jgi:hypothetical protein